MEDHLDRLILESWVAGEATAQNRDIENHLAVCAQCRSFADHLKEERTEFLNAHPFETLRTKQAKQRVFAPFLFRMAAVLAIALTPLFIILLKQTPDETRIKGDTGIKIYALDSAGKPEQRKNLVFHPSERIQFAYSCGPDSEFALLSMDATGAITHYFPDSASTSVPLTKGRGIPLPKSIELDDYLGQELFFALFSKNAFPVKPFTDALSARFVQNPSLTDIIIPKTSGITVCKLTVLKERKN